LTSLIRRNKRVVFSFIRGRMWKWIHGWKNHMLSKAGKIIMITSIAQALLTYSMRVFLISLTLCNELQWMMDNFWWGSGWWHGITRWERLCIWKKDGGIDFQHLHNFNLALLGKLGWELVAKPHFCWWVGSSKLYTIQNGIFKCQIKAWTELCLA
jgi:hypothetical protein